MTSPASAQGSSEVMTSPNFQSAVIVSGKVRPHFGLTPYTKSPIWGLGVGANSPGVSF
jgi:hypothetical protein